MTKLIWQEPWTIFESSTESTLYRGMTDPPDSFVAEVRQYHETGGFMLHVELDVCDLSDGKRLAEAILSLVNAPGE